MYHEYNPKTLPFLNSYSILNLNLQEKTKITVTERTGIIMANPQTGNYAPTAPTVTRNILTGKQMQYIQQKTPSQFIKQRPGPSGRELSYVEVGYVVNVLNRAFGWNWDFRVIEQQIGKKQVWVRGELTVRVDGNPIVKSQYGGSDIRLGRSGESVNIADDLKTAASDCLKKCASLLGIAGDIYWKDTDSSSLTILSN